MKIWKLVVPASALIISSCNQQSEVPTPEHECETHYASVEVTETFPPTVEIIGWEEADTLCICDELVLTFDTNLIDYYLNHGWVQNFQSFVYEDTFVVADSSSTEFAFFLNEGEDSTFVYSTWTVPYQSCD
ncbi:MAG: hypothetical protein RL266_2696 [Bacteroidota bacterium]|jgi:hypothetical protein